MSTFLKKFPSFSPIPNEVLRDKDLSRKAKGLYCEIYSYLSMPKFKLTKTFLQERGLEGQTAFDTIWNELRDKGYLKALKIKTMQDGKVKTIWAYELLRKPRTDIPYQNDIDKTKDSEQFLEYFNS